MSFVRGREPGRKFRVWRGGHSILMRWMPADQEHWGKYSDGDLDSLPVWEVAIPAGDTLSVRCAYPVEFSGGLQGGGASWNFDYFTTSAALWAGTIERADFRIDFGEDWRRYTCVDDRVPPFVSSSIAPADYRWEGSSVLWRFENWEPSENLKVRRFDAHSFSEMEFVDCWQLSDVDCDHLLRLPTCTSSTSDGGSRRRLGSCSPFHHTLGDRRTTDVQPGVTSRQQNRPWSPICNSNFSPRTRIASCISVTTQAM